MNYETVQLEMRDPVCILTLNIEGVAAFLEKRPPKFVGG
jgi:hypothetical protein